MSDHAKFRCLNRGQEWVINADFETAPCQHIDDQSPDAGGTDNADLAGIASKPGQDHATAAAKPTGAALSPVFISQAKHVLAAHDDGRIGKFRHRHGHGRRCGCHQNIGVVPEFSRRDDANG